MVHFLKIDNILKQIYQNYLVALKSYATDKAKHFVFPVVTCVGMVASLEHSFNVCTCTGCLQRPKKFEIILSFRNPVLWTVVQERYGMGNSSLEMGKLYDTDMIHNSKSHIFGQAPIFRQAYFSAYKKKNFCTAKTLHKDSNLEDWSANHSIKKKITDSLHWDWKSQFPKPAKITSRNTYFCALYMQFPLYRECESEYTILPLCDWKHFR